MVQSRRIGALVCALATIAGAGHAQASEFYRIVVIDEAPDFSPAFGPRGGGYLAINNAGVVAYQAVRYVNPLFESAIYIGDGQTKTQVNLGTSTVVGINDLGQVAFTDPNGLPVLWDQGTRRFIVSNCAILGLQCQDRGGGLGNNGRISDIEGANPGRIVTVGPTNAVASRTPVMDNSFRVSPTISRNGLNAAAGGNSGTNGSENSVWVLDPTLVGSLAEFVLCTNAAACSVNGVSVNDRAAVAVTTDDYFNLPQFTGYVGVVSTDPATPGLVRVADQTGPLGFTRFLQSPSINNLNEVAFNATTTTGSGVFVGDVSGRAPTPVITSNEVIRADGALFGGVSQLGFSPHSMNDKGQVAFYGGVNSPAGFRYVVLRADPAPGVTAGNPLLPGPGDVLPGGGWRFRACGTGNWSQIPIRSCPPIEYYDPEYAVGYEYTVEGAGPSFRSVLIPAPLPNGDDAFQVEFDGNVAALKAGVLYDFTTLAPNGVRSFRITGISLAEALDPNDARAFVTGMQYVDPSITNFTITMVPIVENTDPPTDSTPPSITPTVTGVLGNADWYTTDVAVSWAVQDPESAVASTSGCAAANVTADTTGTTFTCTATSAGGTASRSVTIRRDATPPSVLFGAASPAANAAGWNRSTVSVPFSGADATSGIASLTPATSPLTFTGEGADLRATVTAENGAGITNAVTSPSVRIDRTAPGVTIATPAVGATYARDQVVAASYACTDALSGVAGCTGTVANGAPVPTGTSGSLVFEVSATDAAGNTTTLARPYSVAAAVRACSVDFDGDIDRDDVALVTAARNTPASGPTDPRDPNRSGVIDLADARTCSLRCDRPSCATQ